MRKFIILIVLSVIVQVSCAEKILRVFLLGGETVDYYLAERPKITFNSADWIVNYQTYSVCYPLSQCLKCVFVDVNSDPTIVNQNNLASQQFFIEKNQLIAQGLLLNSKIQFFDTNGRMVDEFRVSDMGSVVIPINTYNKGIYIVKTLSQTFKIIRK